MQPENIPYGYCQCGCGGKTIIAPRTVTSKGVVKGRPQRFIQYHSLRNFGKPLADRFWEKVDASGGADACWPWTASGTLDGHGQVYNPGGSRKAARVSWELHIGPIPDGLCVLHRCDNPPCVNPAHLFLGTDADNFADKLAKGRQRGAPGERNGSARLTADHVREIRARRGKETQAAIAETYGVSVSLVGQIHRREAWSHLL